MAFNIHSDDLEVTITLTPLGHDEKENHRVIKMNKEKKEVEIGRASRNAYKGILAAHDNAWFDYPILSRAHAKFTIGLSSRVLYVKDCGSTHGTWLDKMKLENNAEYAVNDGETITFGQRVTSGAVIYPAKQFRVHSKWESRISDKLPSLFVHPPVSRFQVPDEYNDSSSDQSREGSIQILESHPRTFSVPSTDSESDSEDSDVESIEIASSVVGEGNKDSTGTTPDNGNNAKEPVNVDVEEGSESGVPQSNTRGLNLKGPSIVNILSKSNLIKTAATGNSQQDAIDIEYENAHKQNVAEAESDNEGPEVLPFQKTSSKQDQDDIWEEPETTDQQAPLQSITDKALDVDTEDEIERVTVQPKARITKDKELKQHPLTAILHGSSVGGSDGFDSIDELDHNDDFSDYGHEEETISSFSNLMDTALDGVSKPKGTRKEKDPQTSQQNPSNQTHDASKPDLSNVSVSDGIDVSQPAYTDYLPPISLDLAQSLCQEAPSPLRQRAPSPSDAALARNPLDMPLVPGVFETDHVSGSNVGIGHPAGTVNGPFGYQYIPPVAYTELTSPETRSKPYDQGPFASQSQAVSSSVATPWWSYPGDSSDRADEPYMKPRKAAIPEPRSSSYHDINADARYAAELQAEEDAYAAAIQSPSSKPNHPLPPYTKPRKGSEGQSSKINIANLVNAAQVEGSRPLKRKANEMSTMTDAEESHDKTRVPVMTKSRIVQQPLPHPPCGLQSVQETQLPDAQPRDNLSPLETDSLSQDKPVETIDASTPTSTAGQAVGAEGPARKKARTSSSSSRGIGKFVSGVCLGLVGALAAFVAAIPASVREEALREINNGA